MSDKFPRSTASNFSTATQTTPRNRISFKRQPTSGLGYGQPVNVYPDGAYAAMLDTLYETAVMTAEANGVDAKAATHTAICALVENERWRFLPSHVLMVQGLVSNYLKGFNREG